MVRSYPFVVVQTDLTAKLCSLMKVEFFKQHWNVGPNLCGKVLVPTQALINGLRITFVFLREQAGVVPKEAIVVQ